jgi:hypothetical protein
VVHDKVYPVLLVLIIHIDRVFFFNTGRKAERPFIPLLKARAFSPFSVRPCLGCGWSLAPYALGGWFTGLVALALACAGCAVGLQVAWRQRRWVLAPLLLIALLIPPLAVMSFVNGLAQPLIPSERSLSPLIVAQALLVIAYGFYLWTVNRTLRASDQHVETYAPEGIHSD